MNNTKICSKCGRELPLECFGKRKRSKDGLQPYCKECQKQYYTSNREYLLERQKRYNAEHNVRRQKMSFDEFRDYIQYKAL